MFSLRLLRHAVATVHLPHIMFSSLRVLRHAAVTVQLEEVFPDIDWKGNNTKFYRVNATVHFCCQLVDYDKSNN